MFKQTSQSRHTLPPAPGPTEHCLREQGALQWCGTLCRDLVTQRHDSTLMQPFQNLEMGLYFCWRQLEGLVCLTLVKQTNSETWLWVMAR